MIDEAERQRLAAGVFERTRRDLSGDGDYLGDGTARAEAAEWVEAADVGFRWWCAVAGLDWRRARRALLRGRRTS